MEFEIRPYRPEDEAEWMRVHAVILSMSHAWNYTIQERPAYEGHDSTRLVVTHEGRIIGLTDVEYDNTPGEICFLKDSRGGYVLEFGRLPEYRGCRIGKLLIEATSEDAKAKGVRRLEYWSQDRLAQKYYARLGLSEIGRHYRFRMRAPESVAKMLGPTRIGIEYLYCCCLPEEWPHVQAEYEVVTGHPLEPHLCVGYELRF